VPNSPRVLIIDDDDYIAVALYQHLVATSVPVDLATDEARAELLMKEHRYALVVIDAYLTGFLHDRAAALLDRVSVLCPDARVLLLSAYAEPLAGLSTSTNITVVAKPQPVGHLTAVINAFLGEARAYA
jgi:DNA-binding response OmpR family regulator